MQTMSQVPLEVVGECFDAVIEAAVQPKTVRFLSRSGVGVVYQHHRGIWVDQLSEHREWEHHQGGPHYNHQVGLGDAVNCLSELFWKSLTEEHYIGLNQASAFALQNNLINDSLVPSFNWCLFLALDASDSSKVPVSLNQLILWQTSREFKSINILRHSLLEHTLVVDLLDEFVADGRVVVPTKGFLSEKVEWFGVGLEVFDAEHCLGLGKIVLGHLAVKPGSRSPEIGNSSSNTDTCTSEEHNLLELLIAQPVHEIVSSKGLRLLMLLLLLFYLEIVLEDVRQAVHFLRIVSIGELQLAEFVSGQVHHHRGDVAIALVAPE